MFSLIVQWKLKRAFANLNAGRYEPILAGFSPSLEHAFPGTHPLGGTRRTMESTRRWYRRLAGIFPDLEFRIRRIAVSGWPWKASAMVEWTDHFTVGGRPDSNQGVHVFQLRWGRVTGLTVYCDTQKLRDVCEAKALLGVPEAAGAKVTVKVVADPEASAVFPGAPVVNKEESPPLTLSASVVRLVEPLLMTVNFNCCGTPTSARGKFTTLVSLVSGVPAGCCTPITGG